MKHLIAALLMLNAFSAFADSLTEETLTVDASSHSICGVTIGMTRDHVRAELGKRNLNVALGQKFDAGSKSMVPDDNLFSVNSREDRIIYSIMFREGKVWLQEILFAGYSESKARDFALRLWKPVDGTAIDITGQTIQIHRTFSGR